jgi:hypothetical protein
LEIDPADASVWINKGKFEEARCYDKALGISSTKADALFNKGYALLNLAKYNDLYYMLQLQKFR